MRELIKVKIITNSQVYIFERNEDYATIHQQVLDEVNPNLWEKDYALLEPTKEDYLEAVHDDFEAANYHSEFHMVREAVEYMSEEKAIEYLKQVQTP